MSSRHSTWEQAVLSLREQPEQRDLVLAAYYDDPLEQAAERYRTSEEWAAVRNWLPRVHCRVLDVGAGRGISSYALAHEGHAVTALEPDPSVVVGAAAIRSLAASSKLPIEVVEQWSEGLPFPDSSYDVVFSRAVLHHVRDLRQVAREFHRVLRPGGRLLAIREHVISRREDLSDFHSLHPLHRLYGGEHAYLLAEYVEALTSAGFRIEAVIDPFGSAINFAPHSESSLRLQLVTRLGLSGGLARILCALLARPAVWGFARRILARIDNRPGRLYSFVGIRD